MYCIDCVVSVLARTATVTAAADTGANDVTSLTAVRSTISVT